MPETEPPYKQDQQLKTNVYLFSKVDILYYFKANFNAVMFI